MYHKIARPPAASRLKGTYIFPDRFAKQMGEFARAGFKSASMDEALVSGNSGKKFVISFDDGFRNVLEFAAPVLRAHNFRAIQFIVHDLMGATNRWDGAEPQEPLMTKAEVNEWLKAGHEIGSHTMTHADLSKASDADLRREIIDSKKALEDSFGVPIRHFCYPFGRYDRRALALVQEAGYQTACTVAFGLPSAATNPIEIPRLLVCHHRYGSQNPWVQRLRRLAKGMRSLLPRP
jgi:peptidoglycan/xylan/chitin deacetylase (PgdA/CDA1 family)